jgi:hypothetical protein
VKKGEDLRSGAGDGAFGFRGNRAKIEGHLPPPPLQISFFLYLSTTLGLEFIREVGMGQAGARQGT